MSMRYALRAKRSRIMVQLLVEGGLLGLAGAAAGIAFAAVVARTLMRLLFSFAPVLHFLRPDLANALRQNAGTATKRSQRFRKVAVGVQIALSVLLLGGAGLFVRTLDNLRHQSVGFDTANLATFTFDPTISGYPEDRTLQIETSALEALRRIPGVTY